MKATRVLIKSMIVNTFLVLIKIVVGFIGKSSTLIADGVHSLSDLTTDIVAIIGNKMSDKPADREHPYGHGQLQYLTSIIVGVVIFVLGITLIISSFSNEVKTPSRIVLYVSIFTIIVKWCLSSYILKIGKNTNNNILIASGNESRADALTSIFVIVSYLLSKLTPYWEIFKYADSGFTIIIGFYIVVVSFFILKDNVISIIGKIEDDKDYLDSIRKLIMNNKEVVDITDLIIMKYGTYYVAHIEIELNENMTLKEVEKVIIRLKKQLHDEETRIMYSKISTKAKEVKKCQNYQKLKRLKKR